MGVGWPPVDFTHEYPPLFVTHLLHAWESLLNPARFCSINDSWMQTNPGEWLPGT